MGLLSANLLAELQRSTSRTPVAIDIVLASGTTLKLCRKGFPLSSVSLGIYDERVTSFGTLSRLPSGRDGTLDSPTMTIRVDDTDLGFAPNVVFLKGAAVTVRLVSPHLASAADYFVAFPGVVAGYRESGLAWEIDLRMDDAWLRASFPKATFIKGEHPNCHQSALGQPIPIIYGTHSAVGIGDNGMVPTYYTDTVNHRFTIAGHYCKSVPRVYLQADAGPPIPDRIVASTTPVNGALTIAAQPTAATPLTVKVTDGDASITEYVVTIVGTNQAGTAITEVYTRSDDGLDFVTSAAFKTVTTVNGSGLAGSAVGDTVVVGVLDAAVVPTLQTLTTHYTLAYPVVGGRQYTEIRWVGNPGLNPVVTCDVDGIENVGGGTGALLTNAAQQWEHLLHNWVHGDYRRGAWSTPAPLNVTYFTTAATFCSTFAHVGARHIREIRTGEEEVQQFCHDLECMAFWTNAGTLGPLFFEHRLQNAAAYPDNRIVVERDVLGGRIGRVFDDQAPYARFLTRWAQRAVDGTFLQTREDRDPSSAENSQQPPAKDALWLPAAAGYANQARDAASRRINRWRSLMPMLRATLPLWAIDWEIGTDVDITWDRGINEDGTLVWGEGKGKRRPFRIVATEVDFDALEVHLTLQDLLPTQTSFAAGFKGFKNMAGMEDGVFYLALGAWPVPTRASSKWVNDPTNNVTGTLVSPIGTDVLPIDASGLMVEEASTNDLTYSAFGSGTTNWNPTPSGGTIAADTADLLFDGTVTAQSIKITAPAGGGGAMTGNGVIFQACTTAYVIGDKFTVSVDHKDDTGHQISIWIQRSSDSQYWDDTAKSWGAVMPNKPSLRATPGRRSYKNIAIGANATVTVYVGIEKATAVANQAHHVYHVQCEKKRWASSRIVTGAAAGTRAVDTVKVANTSVGLDIWALDQGTLILKGLFAAWAAVDRPGDTPYLWSLEFDANNKLEVSYDCTAFTVKFTITAAGTPYTASMAFSVGTGQMLAVRWTGANGELGLTPFTASVLVEGIRGGTDVVYVTPTRANGKDIYICGKTGTPATNQWDGWLHSVRFVPYALSDATLRAMAQGHIPY